MVYYLAVDGNDSNPGSSAAPFKTWKRALSALTADGDELIVCPGTYMSGVGGAMMPPRPEYKQWVTIRAEEPGSVNIWYGSQYVLLPIRPYTRVIGLNFSGGTGIRWADNAGPKHHVHVERCYFGTSAESLAATKRRCGRPLDLAGGAHIYITQCTFEECVVGPTIGTGTDPIEHVFVEKCVFANNHSETNYNVDGLLIDEPRDPETGTYTSDHDVVVDSCVAYGHGDAGFDIKPVATIRNCIAHDNAYVGFKLWGVGTRLINCYAYNNDDAGASMANNDQLADRCTFVNNGKYAVRPQGLSGQRITRSIIVGPMHNANSDVPSVVVSNSVFWVPGEDQRRWAITGKHTSYSSVVYTWEEVERGDCPAIGENVVLAPPTDNTPAGYGHNAAAAVEPPPAEPSGEEGLTVTLSAEEVAALRALRPLIDRINQGG